jgi:hypothetical protein
MAMGVSIKNGSMVTAVTETRLPAVVATTRIGGKFQHRRPVGGPFQPNARGSFPVVLWTLPFDAGESPFLMQAGSDLDITWAEAGK